MTNSPYDTYASQGPAAPSAGPASGGYRPLRRSSTDRVLGGVCGGLAEYLRVDPVVVRILAVVLAVFGGSGVLLYLVGWLVIPEQGHPQSVAERVLRPQPPAGYGQEPPQQA